MRKQKTRGEDAKKREEALLAPKTSDPFTAAKAKPAATPGTGSVSGASPGASSTEPPVGRGFSSNRAEKYLPQLPVLAHQETKRWAVVA